MRGLHQIGLTSETPIDHTKHKTMLDIANLLSEGHEETKDEAYLA